MCKRCCLFHVVEQELLVLENEHPEEEARQAGNPREDRFEPEQRATNQGEGFFD